MKPILTLLCLLSLMSFACDNNDDDTPGDSSGDPATGVAITNQTTATDNRGAIYTVGFDQVSGNNQNPFVEKRDANGNQLWRVAHEETPVDGRATLVAINDDVPYVVFSVDGGSNNASYITNNAVASGAFSNVYSNSYGSGGGPKVNVVAEIDPSDGNIQRATFLRAQLTNGNTNTFRVTGIGFTNAGIALTAETAAWPPAVGSSYERFPNITDEDRVDGSFRMYYELAADFSRIQRAELRP